MARGTILPLLAVLLLPTSASAQDFGSANGFKAKFKRSKASEEQSEQRRNKDCVNVPFVAVKAPSQDYLTGLMTPFMKGYSDAWTLQYGTFDAGVAADSRPPREMGNDTDKHIFRIAPLVFEKRLTHGDETELRCILAHEAAHAVLKHTQARKEPWEKAVKQCQTKESLAAIGKRINDEFDDSCKKNRMMTIGDRRVSECDFLTDAMIKECAYSNSDYKNLRVAQESQADRKMVDLIEGGAKGAGWSCWGVLSSLPEAPKKPDGANFHPPGKERAKAVLDYMVSSGAKRPCLALDFVGNP